MGNSYLRINKHHAFGILNKIPFLPFLFGIAPNLYYLCILNTVFQSAAGICNIMREESPGSIGRSTSENGSCR